MPDAERRVALIIGNGTYRNVMRLDNPTRDADGVAAALRKAGFELIGGRAQLDLDKRGMEQAIRSFGRSLEAGAVGLFYYSGHGFEIDGHNYLVPVDADPKETGDVPVELVNVDLLLGQIRNAGNRLSMIVLDACRINPFGNRGLRAAGTGLAEIKDRPSGTIISYATAPGKVAGDGPPGTHSPYTASFIEAVQRPGLDVVGAFTWVQSEVDTKTKHEQQPWLGISPIHGQFFFVPPGSTVTITTPTATPSTASDRDIIFWTSVKDSHDSAQIQAYLDQFPRGTFAGLAKVMIEELKRSQIASLPSQPETAIEEIEGSYITVKRANLRAKPLADAKLIKSLEPGVPLTVTGRVKDSGWYRVASVDDKLHGFVFGDAIQDIRVAEEAEWQRVKDAKESDAVATFLKRYPAGTYSEQARLLRDDLLKREKQSEIALDPVERTLVAGRTVRLRAAPNGEAKQVATLMEGESVLIVGKVKDAPWYSVEKDGKRIGYAMVDQFEDASAYRARKENAATSNRSEGPNSKQESQQTAIKLVQQALLDEGALAIVRAGIQSFRDRPAGGQPCLGCPEFVVVPPGSFIMGSDDGRSDERPPHRVTIAKPFGVGKFPVTRGEFAAFVNDTGYKTDGGCATFTGSSWTMRPDRSWRSPGFEQDDRHPVVCINWDDANAFVAWLSLKTRRSYRLLTEAEWEYAARAGTTTHYFFGDNPDELCRYGKGADLTAKQKFPNMEVVNCRDGYVFTAPVGSFEPNVWGLHDMHGNVRERVQDCYNDSYNGAPTDGSAWVTGDCGRRVLRGGSWSSDPMQLRAASRDSGAPRALRYDNYGFRVAREL